MIALLLFLAQDEPRAKVDELGTHVFFTFEVPAPHVIKWEFWGTEITEFSDGTDLGTRKRNESSADSVSFLLSVADDKRVELVARKQAKADVTVEGSFEIWVAEGVIKQKIDRLRLRKDDTFKLGEHELTITQVVRRNGIAYVRAEFSTPTEIDLCFIKQVGFETTDGARIKSSEGGTQTNHHKDEPTERWSYILRWELTTDAEEVAIACTLYDKPERKRFPFKVVAPLKDK